MVEYVYALHDFEPENDDEVSFRAGERIEVVERDDLYGDGWWQGRNLSGKVGLFPRSYTAPAPPSVTGQTSAPPSAPPSAAPDSIATPRSGASPSPNSPPPVAAQLQSLPEEPETGASTPSPSKTDGEVMRATMTDVQKAIEQLGRKEDHDGSQSFTFSSTHEDMTDHETENDTDAEDGDVDFYKNTRQKLADRARMAVEQAAARDAADHRNSLRAPPIDVELSDESDGEDDEHHPGSGRQRRHSHIPEEDETMLQVSMPKVDESPRPMSLTTSESYVVPVPALEPMNIPTATQSTFPTIETSAPVVENGHASRASLPSPVSPGFRRSSQGLASTLEESSSRPSSAQMTWPEKTASHPPIVAAVIPQDPASVLPSPAASSAGHMQGYSVSSTNSSFRAAASSPLSQSQSQSRVPQVALSQTLSKSNNSHPSDWTVDEVLEWLRSKGFDEGVCEKFTEQEITGDVLLDLDINVLKTEIGITAYGKRMRIANAITELRRPPSVISSDHLPAHSHSQSQSLSHSQSLTASSARQSLNSPYTNNTGLSPASAVDPLGSAGLHSVMSPESPPHSGDLAGTPALPGRRDSDPGSSQLNLQTAEVDDNRPVIGLGLGIPAGLLSSAPGRTNKGRPAQLMLSGSDGALAETVKAVSGSIPEEGEEERAVLSESETAQKYEQKTKRKGVFGRHESTSSKHKDKDVASRNSKESTTPLSETSPLYDTGKHSARKRSLDGTRGDRLSIFGGFGGTIGKSRKPPPRYSTVGDGAEYSPEKSGTLSLSRLYPGHSHRKASGRPSTADSPTLVAASLASEKRNSKDSKDSREKKDPTVLRKRTSSSAEQPSSRQTTLKAGKSILEQIGSPDHNGWMRKKGERYNTWKNRYFVLKGPHLYWLRSESRVEVKIKGYINIVGYRIIADEKVDPGRYGFKLFHEKERTHFFSSSEQVVIREWMKALMKATIDRDYTKPVVSSVNIPTIPLAVAQAMNPAPRPPSPTARAATQKALRRENTNQLSTRDAQILMGTLPASEQQVNKNESERPRLESFFTSTTLSEDAPRTPKAVAKAPSRPSREMRRIISDQIEVDSSLIDWANAHLPKNLQITDTSGAICGGLVLMRIAEGVKGRPASPPVPDSAFPSGPNDDKLDGLFRLFDFLLDNDVRMGSVSINDVRQGKRDKIIQLLKALKTWEDKRRTISESIGKGAVTSGPFVA
ncbi:hypothetical protein FA95DRAFT_1524163, partial [Auriscalpium vulgare]